MKRRAAVVLVGIALVAAAALFGADMKISNLAALSATAPGDLFVVVDVSDLSMAASGTNKKLTRANLLVLQAGEFVDTASGVNLQLKAVGTELVRGVSSTTDTVLLRVDNAVITDASIPDAFVAVSVDETNHTLSFRVRYSDGTTMKTGTLALN